MTPKTTQDILRQAADTLATAKLGLRDVLEGGPSRRLGGLRNLIVFGRAVTNVLQNLRSTEDGFDAWYEPYVAEMKGDPLLHYFYKLRSEILKEGTLRTGSSLYIHHLDFPKDIQRLGPPPAGAGAFFMGDQAGGSGWEIAIGNGEVEKFYVDIPGDLAKSEVHLLDAPREHRGSVIADTRIETLSLLFFEYMSGIVQSARQRFGKKGA